MQESARCVYELIVLFEKDEKLFALEPYQLLRRLFSEQCELSSNEQSSKVQAKKKSEGATLQSPYDPDASCGHKGSGYNLHISETCSNAKGEVHGAARSDIGKALPIIERLDAAGLKPETLFADGGYPSAPSTLKVEEQGIEFMAPVNRVRLGDDVVGRDLFEFSSEGLATRCPMGHAPIDHRILSRNNKTRQSLHAIFDGRVYRSCTMLDRCPVRAPNHRAEGCRPCDVVVDFRLEITFELHLRDHMHSIQQSREWKDRCKIRAGIKQRTSN